MTWSDSPPIEDGWYWLYDEPVDVEFVAYFNSTNCRWWFDNHRPVKLPKGTQFGPRIPTPDELEAMRTQIAAVKQCFHEIEQVLGKALGYPPAYPDASRTDDGVVCIGDHVPETLAIEAAWKIAELTQQRDAAEAELARCHERLAEIDTGG